MMLQWTIVLTLYFMNGEISQSLQGNHIFNSRLECIKVARSQEFMKQANKRFQGSGIEGIGFDCDPVKGYTPAFWEE